MFLVTAESGLSDEDSELSSLDIRIREALSRPISKLSTSTTTQSTAKATAKPLSRVRLTCNNVLHSGASKGNLAYSNASVVNCIKICPLIFI